MPNEFTEQQDGSESSSQALTAPISPEASSATFGGLKDRIVEDISTAKGTIEEGAGAAVEKAKEAITEQTNFATRQVAGVASALEKVGFELEGSDQQQVGRYARQIGQNVQSLAKQMEGKDIGEIATMAEDFGRRQPLAFLGLAALVGLTASRFLTASANRPTRDGARRSPSTSVQDNASIGGNDNG